MTKASEAWQRLFEKHNIAERVNEEGYFDISSRDFKALHLEPRLLTKVDHSHQIPTIMREHRLSILTLSSSTWRIGPFEIFEKLPAWTLPDNNVFRKALPGWLESLTVTGITGEGALMNAALASGILSDFCGEELVGTITGKGRSGTFEFRVDNKSSGSSHLEVRSAQIEIDAGFEGPNSLYLFEAKKHLAVDFNIRQLYYPFRTWRERVTKNVRPIFMTLANDVFDITEFEFAETGDMSSIEMVGTKRYMLSTQEISEREILDIAKRLEGTSLQPGAQKVPFPQADDFERVIDITEFVATEPRSSEDISLNYEFHPRQADYYFSAARYLGLGEIVRGSDGINYRQVTPLAQKLVSLSYAEKRKEFAALILRIPAVREVYLLKVEHGVFAGIAEVERIVAEFSANEGISGSTIHRRAQTVLAWARWLFALGQK